MDAVSLWEWKYDQDFISILVEEISFEIAQFVHRPPNRTFQAADGHAGIAAGRPKNI